MQPLADLARAARRASSTFPARSFAAMRPSLRLRVRQEAFRLGHVVLKRQEFARNANWYVRNLGLIASDIELLPGTRGAADRVPSLRRVERSPPTIQRGDRLRAGGRFRPRRIRNARLRRRGTGRRVAPAAGLDQVLGRRAAHPRLADLLLPLRPERVRASSTTPTATSSMQTGRRATTRAASQALRLGADLPKHFIDTGMSPRRLAKVVRGLRSREEFTLARLIAAKRAYSGSRGHGPAGGSASRSRLDGRRQSRRSSIGSMCEALKRIPLRIPGPYT